MAKGRKMNKKNEENLRFLIQENKDTEFGRRHNFKTITNMQDYRKQVPLSTYEDYDEDILRMKNGQKGILTSFPIVGFCQSSGTEAEAKYIPFSQEQVLRYSDHIERYVDEVFSQVGGKRLFVNSFRVDLWQELPDSYLLSELYYKSLWEKTNRGFDDYAGGKEVIFQPKPMDNLYVKAWCCLAEENITLFESIYLYDILMLFHYIEENWNKILNDMKTSHISAEVPQEVREALFKKSVSQERIQKIEEEFNKGVEQIVKRLWPRIRLLVGISAMNFFAEDMGLDLYAKGVPKYYLCYISSECLMGVAKEEDDFTYELLPDTAVYEFLKENQKSGQTMLPDELEVGKYYEPVISNFAGLYRYCTGDILCCVGRKNGIPLLRYIKRKKSTLNVVGEKMESTHFENAIYAIRKKGIRVGQFCFSFLKDEIPVRYVLVLTLLHGKETISEEQISKLVDLELRKQNLDYDDLQNLEKIGPLLCVVLSKEQFDKFRENNHLKQGHGKPKHIQRLGLRRAELQKRKEQEGK